MNFNNLDDESCTKQHIRLLECANTYGGMNYFLQLLEAMRATKPHPLISKNCNFYFALGGIKWNKVIFKDKLTLLLTARLTESKNGNLLPSPTDKSYKSVLNLIRTMGNIEFKVSPKNIKDGEGFTMTAFDTISEDVVRLNPVFDAVFFSSIENVKKVLNYKADSSHQPS